MRVYIVRHGKAEDASPSVRDDASPMEQDFARELTIKGRQQAEYLAQAMTTSERRVRAIFASRYPRAMQTAHVLWESIKCDLRTDLRLEVDHPVSEAIDLIHEHVRERPNDREIMIVAHNPQLGELIGVLCSGLPARELILKTGELVCIEVRPGQIVGSGKIVERWRLAEESETPTGAGRSGTR